MMRVLELRLIFYHRPACVQDFYSESEWSRSDQTHLQLQVEVPAIISPILFPINICMALLLLDSVSNEFV